MAIVLALGAASFYGSADFMGGLASRRSTALTAAFGAQVAGLVVLDGADFLERLVLQVANPVRWDICMETMADLGVTGLLELTPAGTLTGIARRNLRGVELFNLNTPNDLDDARAFVSTHA